MNKIKEYSDFIWEDIVGFAYIFYSFLLLGLIIILTFLEILQTKNLYVVFVWAIPTWLHYCRFKKWRKEKESAKETSI